MAQVLSCRQTGPVCRHVAVAQVAAVGYASVPGSQYTHYWTQMFTDRLLLPPNHTCVPDGLADPPGPTGALPAARGPNDNNPLPRPLGTTRPSAPTTGNLAGGGSTGAPGPAATAPGARPTTPPAQGEDAPTPARLGSGGSGGGGSNGGGGGGGDGNLAWLLLLLVLVPCGIAAAVVHVQTRAKGRGEGGVEAAVNATVDLSVDGTAGQTETKTEPKATAMGEADKHAAAAGVGKGKGEGEGEDEDRGVITITTVGGRAVYTFGAPAPGPTREVAREAVPCAPVLPPRAGRPTAQLSGGDRNSEQSVEGARQLREYLENGLKIADLEGVLRCLDTDCGVADLDGQHQRSHPPPFHNARNVAQVHFYV